LHYQYCLCDAAGPRRAAALYGLGNSLLRQYRERGPDALHAAIQTYVDCLGVCEPGSDLAINARHNLELAKLLLPTVLPKGKRPEVNPPGAEPKIPFLGPEEDEPDEPHGRPGMARPHPKGKARPAPEDPEDEPNPTDDQQPGSGPRPIPDTADLEPISPHDAEQHLHDALKRIRKDQQIYRSGRAGTGRLVPD
jgi:hypothetical protein